MSELPSGFVLDQPPGAPPPMAPPPLPPGFVLDTQTAALPTTSDAAPAWHTATPSDVSSGVAEGERVIDVGGRQARAARTADPESAAPSRAESALRGAWQGATLNFGDELQGAAAASPFAAAYPYLPSLNTIAGGARLAAEKVAPGMFGHGGSDAYDEAVARARAANEAARNANPGTYLAGELAGGVAGALATPAVAPVRLGAGAGRVAQAMAPIANAGATGAVYGAVAGAGAGEGGIADRLPSAGMGAATGLAVGGGLGVAGQALGVPARYVADHVNAWRNPEALADRVVSRNFARDAADVPALAHRMEEAAAQRPAAPVTAADIAGPNTQGVAGTIARTPGPARAQARNFLEDRHVGSETQFSQAERISDRVGRLLGDQGSVQAAEGIITRRTAQSRPAYEAAFGREIDYASAAGRELRALLDRVPNEVRANANRIHTIEDTNGHQLVWGHVPDARGMFPLQAVPNSRQWDYIKRGLDTAVERHTNPAGELDTTGRALDGLRRDIVTATNRANPALANARRIFAGHSELADALRNGQSIWRQNVPADAIRRDMAALSPGEQEMFRLGAANALREKVANSPDTANKVRFINGSPALREKLRVIAPDERSYATTMRFLTDETAMAGTRQRATGGSATAERVAEDAGVGHDLTEGVHVLKNMAHGNVMGLIGQAARHLSKLDPERRGEVLEHARRIILNPDPQALRDFAQRTAKLPIPAGARTTFTGAILKAASQNLAGKAGQRK